MPDYIIVVENLVKKFGAVPVNIPPAEMYMALKLKTVDGVMHSAAALDQYKLKEVVTHVIYEPNVSALVGNLLINMDSLKALPEDIRTLVTETTLPLLSFAYTGFNVLGPISIMKAGRDYGIKTISLTGEARDKALAAGFALWDPVAAKGKRNAELVNILRQQMKDYGRMK